MGKAFVFAHEFPCGHRIWRGQHAESFYWSLCKEESDGGRGGCPFGCGRKQKQEASSDVGTPAPTE